MSGTRQKTLAEQSSQTSVPEGRGEALDAESEVAEPLMAKPAPESPAVAEQLISWEIPRLCRGGSRSLTYPAVRAPAIHCH